jgi:archaellin
MKKFFSIFLVLLATLSLAACGNKAEEVAALNEAVDRILFFDTGSVTQNLTLPTSLVGDVSVSWSSNNPDVITNAGVVIRPEAGEDDVDVVLTATLTKGKSKLVQTYEFTVIAMPVSTAYTDFSVLYAEGSLGQNIEVEGIVVHMFKAGYFLFDGTDFFAVYKPGHEVVSLGDRVVVVGEYAVYNTLYQAGSVTSETVLSSNNAYTLPAATELSIEAVNALDSADKLIHGRVYTVTGTVELRGSFNNVVLVDGDEDLMVYMSRLQVQLMH